jgi:hypothetical protein
VFAAETHILGMLLLEKALRRKCCCMRCWTRGRGSSEGDIEPSVRLHSATYLLLGGLAKLSIWGKPNSQFKVFFSIFPKISESIKFNILVSS